MTLRCGRHIEHRLECYVRFATVVIIDFVGIVGIVEMVEIVEIVGIVGRVQTNVTVGLNFFKGSTLKKAMDNALRRWHPLGTG